MGKTLDQYLEAKSGHGNYRFRYGFWGAVRELEREGSPSGGYAKAIWIFHIIQAVARRVVGLEKAGESIVNYCRFMGVSKPELIRWLKMAVSRVEAAKLKDRDYFTLLDAKAAEIHRLESAQHAEDRGQAHEAGRLRYEPTRETSQTGTIERSDKGKEHKKRKV